MSDLYRIDKERLDSMSDYQKHRVETALGTALHDEVLIPVSDERLTRAEWEATIDYEAAAMAHALNLGFSLKVDGKPFDDIYQECRVILDAAAGEDTP